MLRIHSSGHRRSFAGRPKRPQNMCQGKNGTLPANYRATSWPDRGEKAMSITRRLSRRRFLRVSGLAAGGLTLPCLVFAQNKKAVHFTLPWVAEGSNLFTFVAKGMGFWEKHGLDVDIARGSGSVAAAQATGEARFDSACARLRLRSFRPLRGCLRWRSLPAHMTRRWASAC
jgi:hypothetical protein